MRKRKLYLTRSLSADRIDYIKRMLAERDVLHFPDIFSSARPSRIEIVVSFMAILELAKTRVVKLMQHKIFGIIRIMKYVHVQ